MPIEKPPVNPVPSNYIPPGGVPYKVRDNDNWGLLATKIGMSALDLIAFNFKTRNPDEVNWYLRRNVGCKKQTADGKNWMFSSDASPGIIYFPPAKKAGTTTTTATDPKPAPKNVCPEELMGAQATLTKSQEMANTILRPRATSDLPYWFARLYQYITDAEIAARDTLAFPCFLLHFIPVFYDSYWVAADAFKKDDKSKIPDHWQDHFSMAGLLVDSSQLYPYVNAVTKSLIAGVTAHIKGDMAASLEKAYRSFSTKYTGVPPFDTFKPDFFERNRPVFDKVRVTLVNELVNRGLGFAAFGKRIDPDFASKAGDMVNAGMDITEIYKWREEAWQTAKRKLGQ